MKAKVFLVTLLLTLCPWARADTINIPTLGVAMEQLVGKTICFTPIPNDDHASACWQVVGVEQTTVGEDVNGKLQYVQNYFIYLPSPQKQLVYKDGRWQNTMGSAITTPVVTNK